MLELTIRMKGSLRDIDLGGWPGVDVGPRHVFEEVQTAAGVGGIRQYRVQVGFTVCRDKLSFGGMPKGMCVGFLVWCEAIQSLDDTPVVNSRGHAL